MKSYRAFRWMILSIVLASCLWADNDGAAASAASEYAIKSAMLCNFAKFIDWPAEALPAGAPLVVGVVGDDLVYAALEDNLRHKTSRGHPLVVRRLDRMTDPKSCHVLYLGTSDRKAIARILRKTGGTPVLTVGDHRQFTGQGGMLAFISDGPHIRFEVNLDAAGRGGLQISSRLLRLAEIFRECPQEARKWYADCPGHLH